MSMWRKKLFLILILLLPPLLLALGLRHRYVHHTFIPPFTTDIDTYTTL
jgi:hypothetical protein